MQEFFEHVVALVLMIVTIALGLALFWTIVFGANSLLCSLAEWLGGAT